MYLSSSEIRHLPARSVPRPHQSLYFAFLHLTWPIPGKGCASRRKCVILRRVQSRSVARPGQSIAKIERPRKSCNFTSRSVTRPGQSIVKIERHASRLEKCATLPRVFDFDLSNPWEGLRVTPQMCHFTTRSVAFNRSTRPIHCRNRGAERFDKMCNFTSPSVPRPRQSIVKIDASRLTL